MQKKLSKIIARILRRLGLYSSNVSLSSAFERCLYRGTEIATIIDVGASNGSWSMLARNYFTKAFCYLIEANPYHAKALKVLKSQLDRCDFILAAAGDKVGKIYFNGSDPFGGLASHNQTEDTNLEVPVITIDYIVDKCKLEPPYLLKLDTHGFEEPIFEGAIKTLTKTNLIIVETYNFDLTPQSLRFYQMCEYLERKGFRCIDICDPLFRDKDGALWQFDLFFIPLSSSSFDSNQWL
jgi:FkbM family methyltransferase